MRTVSARTLTLAVVASGIVATAAVILVPGLRFAYRNPRLHVMLETAEGLVALLTAFLVLGRWTHTRLKRYAMLVFALTLFGINNLFTAALSSVFDRATPEVFGVWWSLTSRFIGASAFATAAFSGEAKSKENARPEAGVVAAAVVCGVVALICWIMRGSLPMLVTVLPSDTSSAPVLEGHPFAQTVQVLNIFLYAAAAYGFTRRSEKTGDTLMRWFGAGAGLSAVARINYLLFPSLYTRYVYMGDVLRLGFYSLLLIGASTEIRSYWRERSRAEVLEARRELAQELHDGLAQELVFVAGQTRRIQRGRAPDVSLALEELASAADRAVAEARRAIDALGAAADDPLSHTVRKLAEEMPALQGVKLSVLIDDASIGGGLVLREGLIRIVREALVNVSKHSGAQTVTVGFIRKGSEACLSIEDDGVGFVPGALSPGFGITSMRERAASLGGELTVISSPGAGTRVEVSW